jgi:hypothetical protein
LLWTASERGCGRLGLLCSLAVPFDASRGSTGVCSSSSSLTLAHSLNFADLFFANQATLLHASHAQSGLLRVGTQSATHVRHMRRGSQRMPQVHAQAELPRWDGCDSGKSGRLMKS